MGKLANKGERSLAEPKERRPQPRGNREARARAGRKAGGHVTGDGPDTSVCEAGNHEVAHGATPPHHGGGSEGVLLLGATNAVSFIA